MTDTPKTPEAEIDEDDIEAIVAAAEKSRGRSIGRR